MTRGGRPLRLGVVLDAALEGWTSMEYVGEMLVDTLRREHSSDVEVTPLQPWAPRLFGSLPGPAQWARKSIDRFITRCAVYPIAIGLQRWRFDAFHIVDHSYAHTAHGLPGHRTGIYCHDLDALRLLTAGPAVVLHQRLLARSVLRALERAAVVFYSTAQVRRQIVDRGLLDEGKLVYAPYGVAAEFAPLGPTDEGLDRSLPAGRFVLHVGSGEPRKRLELLIRSFAAVKAREPDVILVQQGADLTHEQQELLDAMGIRSSFVQLPKRSRASLAHLYRRASLVVVPSEREGFGLPVIEALACGTPVLGSDIPAFREVGGEAAAYCGAAEPAGWAAAILRALGDGTPSGAKEARLRQASLFSWSRHAEIVLSAYRALG